MADDVASVVAMGVARRPEDGAARGTQAEAAGSTGSVLAESAVNESVSAAVSNARVRPSTINFPGRRLAGGCSEEQNCSSQKNTFRAKNLHRLLLSGINRTSVSATSGENATFAHRGGCELAPSPSLYGSFSFSTFVRIRRQTRSKVAPENSCSTIFRETSDTTIKLSTPAQSARRIRMLPVTRHFGLRRLCRR